MDLKLKSLIWLNRSKANKKGMAPIYIRVTRDKNKIEIATGLSIYPKYWNSSKGKALDGYELASQINQSLDGYKSRISQIRSQMILNDEYIDLNKIKDLIIGRGANNKTLLEAIAFHNKRIAAEVGRTYALNTFKKYLFFERKMIKFLRSINRRDILLKDLNHQFLLQFQSFMVVSENNKPNTVLKEITALKKVMNMALDYDWLNKSPFKRIKIEKEEPPRTYLNESELNTIRGLEIHNKSVAKIRDMFIFQCFTGLAFIDLLQIANKHINIGIDGNKWIRMRRQKTGGYFSVPLLSPVLILIEKYFSTDNNTTVFNHISNQKYNAGLKKLMRYAGVDKKISSHSGRRTFATTVTLSNGVPIETVSKLLGHSDLRVTQIYAKVIDKKIAEDMKDVSDKLKNAITISITNVG